MDSKKRLSYQWRLFIPVVLTMWTIVAAMAWWNVYRVTQVRKDMVYDQLKLVCATLAQFNVSDEEDTEDLLKFTNRYYSENKDYGTCTVRIFDTATGKLKNAYGPEVNLPMPDIRSNHSLEAESNDHATTIIDGSKYIFFAQDSDDGASRIVTILPISGKLAVPVSSSTQRFWMLVLSLGIFATFMAYISTRYLSQNIRLMRDFASRASSDPDFMPSSDAKFPDDELGDISREIMSIYQRLVREMHAREQEHRVAINAVEEKSRVKRELVSNVNHEIKTPVGIIKGYIDTIMADPDMPADTHWRFLTKIKNNVDRLTNLITDISMITKLENNGQLVNISEVDFHDVVFKFADDVKIVFPPQTSISFTHNVPLNCKVRGNESLLVSVLNNLVRNAQLYSQGTFCRLEYMREDDDFYYFSFYDDGVGVPPEALPEMFERFFRVNTGRSRNAGGTGLGLPIVKATIESLGGTIDVNNRNPSGLIYHFTVPKWTTDGSQADAPTNA